MAMAAFANLSREERVGLGIAAVAHVALIAALWLNVQDTPTALPIPERCIWPAVGSGLLKGSVRKISLRSIGCGRRPNYRCSLPRTNA